MKNTKNKKGAATVIFMAVIAMVLMILLTATQSRLLLSLRRSLSLVDTLAVGYASESEVNDVMARLSGGYLDSANIAAYTKNIGDTKLVISGEEEDGTQTVTVTASKGFATSKVKGVRRVQNVEEVNEVEIVLMLDCTGSMDDGSGTPGKTRFDAEEEAAISFVQKLAALPDASKFKLGIGIFGINSKWLQYEGRDIVPGSGLTYAQIISAIGSGFNSKRAASPECLRLNTDGTNVGLAYRHAHDYLKTSKSPKKKQVEIVVTDGEPNSRSLDSECTPSEACTLTCSSKAINYLRCTVADKDTFVPEIGYNGTRDPEVSAYAVTIFDKPYADVVSTFQSYASEDGYFNATRANQLSGILENVLTKILEDRSTVTIERVIPDPL